MKKLLLVISAVVLFSFSNCKKDSGLEVLEPKPKLYITGKFGGEKIDFLYNTEGISYYIVNGGDPLSNELRLIMNSEPEFNQSRYLQLSVRRIDLENLTLPWKTDSLVTYPRPYASISLIDNTNDNNYTGAQLLNDYVFIQINAVVGDTVEGIFRGEIKSPSGNKLEIKNGEFRAAFSRLNL